jgi:hypothetical protein
MRATRITVCVALKFVGIVKAGVTVRGDQCYLASSGVLIAMSPKRRLFFRWVVPIAGDPAAERITNFQTWGTTHQTTQHRIPASLFLLELITGLEDNRVITRSSERVFLFPELIRLLIGRDRITCNWSLHPCSCAKANAVSPWSHTGEARVRSPPVRVLFVADEVSLRQVNLRVCRLSPVSTSPPVLHFHSFIHPSIHPSIHPPTHPSIHPSVSDTRQSKKLTA